MPKQATDRATLGSQVALARSQGRRVVFTNGCFDILHRGHVAYLNRAKALGDVLIVGLNTDAGVRRLKGAGRPINPLDDRAQVLAALSCVDFVAPFDEDTPAELIRLLRPDVFVKGGDYTVDRLPEAPLVRELGGEVQILPFVEDRSTSLLIERIGSTYAGERESEPVTASAP
jgi:D-beta-D-heptose 7-phosphate kinase / D-beta-D-heptose 1-phosphate adenosyltransferase